MSQLHQRSVEMLSMIRKIADESKVGEFKSGRDAATDQREIAQCPCSLPRVAPDDGCRVAPGKPMWSQLPQRRLVGVELQRSPPVKVPDLVRRDYVPTTDLMPLQQVVDAG